MPVCAAGVACRPVPRTSAGEPLAPRDFVQAKRQALWQEHSPVGRPAVSELRHRPIDSQAAWYCTTCAACLEICPVYGAPFKVISKKRTLLVEEGKGVPDLMNQTLERLFNYENPWVASKREQGCLGQGPGNPGPESGRESVPSVLFRGLHHLLSMPGPRVSPEPSRAS